MFIEVHGVPFTTVVATSYSLATTLYYAHNRDPCDTNVKGLEALNAQFVNTGIHLVWPKLEFSLTMK